MTPSSSSFCLPLFTLIHLRVLEYYSAERKRHGGEGVWQKRVWSLGCDVV